MTDKEIQIKYKNLLSRVTRLEQENKKLKDILNIHNNWHSETHNWVGRLIRVADRSGKEVMGVLKWSDRYNICIVLAEADHPRVYPKGGIDWLELA